MTIACRLTKAVGLLLLLLAVAGCNKSQTDEHEQKVVGHVIGTSVYHESACPIRIVESEAAFSDTALTCLLSVISVTRSPITSFEVRCAVKDTSGDLPRAIGPPLTLKWVGWLAPADTVSPVLSTAVRFRDTLGIEVNLAALLAELEPLAVSYEGNRRWERTGPVPQ